MSDRKQINFTIVPDDDSRQARTYANFCGVNHTPFDFTLTFCEVQPLSEKEIRDAEAEHVVKAPVRAKIVIPVQFVPTLIAALQENLRIFSESHQAPQTPPPPGKGPVH
jgi:hypothetical protein